MTLTSVQKDKAIIAALLEAWPNGQRFCLAQIVENVKPSWHGSVSLSRARRVTQTLVKYGRAESVGKQKCSHGNRRHWKLVPVKSELMEQVRAEIDETSEQSA